MNKHLKAKVCFILILSYILSLNAQKPKKIDSITQLDEVMLIDALKKKNSFGIIKSEVISAKVFQNYSPVSIVPAINQVPGVYVFSGALNTNRITVRGIGARTLFGTNKLRMYYNDIPITDGSGFSTIEAFDLENLSQIEIIKGPKGTSYGANLGGALILNPKKSLGNATTISNNFTAGSFGLLKNNISLNHNEGKLRLGLQYGHMETDGYRQNNNFERDGFLLNTSYEINNKNKIALLINHIDYTAQIPSSLGATAFAEDPQQATFTWRVSQGFETNNYSLVGLNYAHTFNDNFKNSTSLFYTYLDHYEARPFGILDEQTNGFGFRTNFSGRFPIGNQKADYSFGGELYKDEYNWNEFANLYQDNNGNGSLQGDLFAANKEFRQQWNAFGTLLYPLSDKFSAQLGLSINKTNYDYKDVFNTGTDNKSANRNFKAIVLPSLNLKYAFSKDHELYANISRGFSNPTLEETLTPDGVINPDIAQEIGTSYEVGSALYFDKRRLHFNITLYQMNVNDLLVAERIGDDQFVGKNAGKTRHRGLELGVVYNLNISTKVTVNPFINLTLTDHSFVDFIDEGENFSGKPLTGVPKQRASSGLQFQFFKDFYLNTIYQHVGAIPLTDANSLSSDPFNIFNSRMGYYKKISKHFSIGLDFGINNLFNSVYAQSVLINTQGFGGREPRYFYPGDERNYYGSFRLGWQL